MWPLAGYIFLEPYFIFYRMGINTFSVELLWELTKVIYTLHRGDNQSYQLKGLLLLSISRNSQPVFRTKRIPGEPTALADPSPSPAQPSEFLRLPVSCGQLSTMDSKDFPKGSSHEDIYAQDPWLQDLEGQARMSCHAVPLSPEGLTPSAGDWNIVNNGNFFSV